MVKQTKPEIYQNFNDSLNVYEQGKLARENEIIEMINNTIKEEWRKSGSIDLTILNKILDKIKGEHK